MSDSDTLRGTVKWFNDAKGFGFIEHNTGRDVFVHYSVIEANGFKTLKDGEEVTYEIKEGPKGLHAVKVQRAEGEDSEDDSSDESTGDDENADEVSSDSSLATQHEVPVEEQH